MLAKNHYAGIPGVLHFDCMAVHRNGPIKNVQRPSRDVWRTYRRWAKRYAHRKLPQFSISRRRRSKYDAPEKTA